MWHKRSSKARETQKNKSQPFDTKMIVTWQITGIAKINAFYKENEKYEQSRQKLD